VVQALPRPVTSDFKIDPGGGSMYTKTAEKQTFTPSKQNAAIELIASGCTLRFTALVLGIKDSTIYQWFDRDMRFQSLKITSQYKRVD
jgi:hypothetical protein